MPAPLFRDALHSAQSRIRETFLLERAERTVRAITPEQQREVRRFYDAATKRFAGAVQVSQGQHVIAALILYREAAWQFMKAVIVAQAPETDVDGLELPVAWQRLAALSADGQLPLPPAFVTRAAAVLSQPHPLAFDHGTIDDLLSWRSDAEATVVWLRGLVEPRTVQQVRSSRLRRLALAAVVILGTSAWGLTSLLRPRNLALHRPVTISERHPKSTAPPDNGGLVNGRIEPTYGIQTTAKAAWVMIDLQAIHAIDKVKVFNRADAWLDEGLPLTLEFSDDGRTFTEVARRTDGFTSSQPWVFDGGGPNGNKRARFVRIRSDKYIALTEVEVTGLN